MTTVAAPRQPPTRPHPVVFDVAYPERLSRLLIFVKWLLAIPQLIVVYLLLIAFSVLSLIAWFAILFTGRYPKSFFEFSTGTMRWTANVFAYFSLLRDEYPPFSWEPGEYPLVLDIPRAERQSRFRLFIRWFAVLPNMLALYVVQFAWVITSFIAWWAILFSGRYPRGLFRFNVGVMRWYFRQSSYLYLLRDEYPPYSVNADARPGNEVASAIVGLPLGVAYIALQLLPFVSIFAGGGDRERVNAALLEDAGRLARERPAVEGAGLEITLVGFDEDASLPPGARDDFPLSSSLTRLVAFDLHVEKSGWMPTMYTPLFFSLEVCGGYEVEQADEATSAESADFRWFWRDGEEAARVYFWVPPDPFGDVCELSYFTFGGSLTFEFN